MTATNTVFDLESGTGTGHGAMVKAVTPAASTAAVATATGTATGQSVTPTPSRDQHQSHNEGAIGISQVLINAPRDVAGLEAPGLDGDYVMVDMPSDNP